MSNGPPPICDPACQKIILNSGNISILTRFLRQRIKATDHPPLADHSEQEISAICDDAEAAVRSLEGRAMGSILSPEAKRGAITFLNHHEDEVCRAQALFLKAVGYDGPAGRMLQ